MDDFAAPVDLSCNGKFVVGEDCVWTIGQKGPTNAALASTAADELSVRHALWSHWDEDAGQPIQTWNCSSFYDLPCECSGPDCPFDAGWPWPIGADLVLPSPELLASPVDVSGGALSALSCDAGN